MQGLIYLGIGFLSALMGSFCAMLIYRLPLLLQQQWKKEYQLYVNEEQLNNQLQTFDIISSFSYCPNCQHLLTFLQKIPLLSYIFLKGKCAFCKKEISLRYPLVEVLALVCSLLVMQRFGLNIRLVAGLILTYGLLILAFIDFEVGLLPNSLVIPLLWLGLSLNAFHLFVSPESAIFGTIFAYLSLFTIAKGYQWITKREGMGQGDMKCFALLGAWFGITALPYILFFAALLGSLIGLGLLIIKKDSLQTGLAFGPYLAIAGWLALLNMPLVT